MKNTFTTTALVLVAALGASASFAGDNARLNNVQTSPFFAKSAPSVLSRDYVRSEYAAAVKSGNAPARGENSGVRESSVTSTVTRSAVKAEFLQAQKAGTLPPMGDRG